MRKSLLLLPRSQHMTLAYPGYHEHTFLSATLGYFSLGSSLFAASLPSLTGTVLNVFDPPRLYVYMFTQTLGNIPIAKELASWILAALFTIQKLTNHMLTHQTRRGRSVESFHRLTVMCSPR